MQRRSLQTTAQNKMGDPTIDSTIVWSSMLGCLLAAIAYRSVLYFLTNTVFYNPQFDRTMLEPYLTLLIEEQGVNYIRIVLEKEWNKIYRHKEEEGYLDETLTESENESDSEENDSDTEHNGHANTLDETGGEDSDSDAEFSEADTNMLEETGSEATDSNSDCSEIPDIELEEWKNMKLVKDAKKAGRLEEDALSIASDGEPDE